MSWNDDVKEIERQRRMAEQMGGADSVAFQHGRGKLTVRERVDLLADPGTFHEIGALAGTATWEDGTVAALKPSNMVVGTVRVNWGPGWTMPEREAWLRRLEEATSEDNWILDGNYSATLDVRLAKADTVLFLDFPPHICVWRAIKRYTRHCGTTRPDMAPGCEERLTLGFLHWIWTFRSRRRDELNRRLTKHTPKAGVVVLRSQNEIDRYVEKLAAGRAG